jgi:hypothetical protein
VRASAVVSRSLRARVSRWDRTWPSHDRQVALLAWKKSCVDLDVAGRAATEPSQAFTMHFSRLRT